MNELYEFVVLRLTPDPMRGETINAGLIVFNPDSTITVRVSAPLHKLRALDATWGRAKVADLENRVQDAIAHLETTRERVRMLASLGLCRSGEPGFFFANRSAVAQEIRDIESMYVVPPGSDFRGPTNALLKELLSRLRGMSLLGTTIEDLANHLAVAHVPIPGNPDLKGDLVYKNGVYRITQTVDYRVAPVAARRKVSEVCTKVMATTQAAKHWGDGLKKFAMIRVPEAVADIADPHIDLLLADGFEVFHYDKPDDLARYHDMAFSH